MMLMVDRQDFPWAQLTPPKSGYRSILVDVDSPWNFFWARKQGNGPCLLLRTNQKFEVSGRSLKGLDLEIDSDGSAYLLAITLINELDSDVFEYFCRRLVSSCSRCSNETEVVSTLLLEIERWHDFLGRIRSGLTLEQRMGLFGELTFLRRILEFDTPASVLSKWSGPNGGSRDFHFANAEVEVKSVGKGQSRVRISSEFQLDEYDCENLYLKIFTLCDSDIGQSVFDISTSIFALLGPVEALVFQSKLDSVGAVDLSQLNRDSWTVCSESTFKIEESFPSLRHSKISSAITSVQYRLNINALEQFICGDEVLTSVLIGGLGEQKG
jgi:hypothetical protein